MAPKDEDGPRLTRIEQRMVDAVENLETRARFLRWAWWLSLIVLAIGYALIFDRLF